MYAARLPATVLCSMLLIALSWVRVGVGSNKIIRVLYCHDSDADILHYSIVQAMRYSTRGVHMPLSSALISHLRMIDHQRISPPPRFCPCIAVPLPLRVRWPVTIQELICKTCGAVTASDLSEPWINSMHVHRLSLHSRIDEF
ncbi:hypothetical protein BGY98DRAFT_439258 [Russula aff. rugulosa BPL654]|nr:hypothetical protein BGY98DRAFT_439258 [Russula aff. rugulosa BPL654]